MLKSLSEQTVEELGGESSVLARQKKDHIELNALLNELESSEAKDEVLRRTARLVFPHAFAEETVIWPVIRKTLPDGDALTLQIEKEHQEVNELYLQIEALPEGSPKRKPLIERLVEVLKEDVRNEVDVLLPRLQERMSKKDLRRLGMYWEAARMAAPTRAHPVVSRRPPGNALTGGVLSLLDRSRDLVEANKDSIAAQTSTFMERLSSGLSSASRWVESSSVGRSGEKDETRKGE